MSASQKLTPWFPASIKPARPGVYQRYQYLLDMVVYSRWSGEFWCMNADSFQVAKETILQTTYPNLLWRGLAEDPSKKGAKP